MCQIRVHDPRIVSQTAQGRDVSVLRKGARDGRSMSLGSRPPKTWYQSEHAQ